MGASLSVAEDPDFISAQQDLRTLKATLSDYPTLKTKVADLSSAVAGSLNYDNLAAKITDVDAYNRKIADKISDSPGKLGDSLNQKMADNANFIAKIGKLLEDNTKFTDSLAATLTDTSKTYRTKITGPKGDSGELSSSPAAVKDSLYNKKYTVWCADGDVCQLPVGSKGFSSGEDITLTPKTAVKVSGNANVSGNLGVVGHMKIGDTHLTSEGEWLRLLSDPKNVDSYNKGLAVKNLWSTSDLGVARNANVYGNLGVVGHMKIGDTHLANEGGYIRFLSDPINNTSYNKGFGAKYLYSSNDTEVGRNLTVAGTLKIGQWVLEDIGGDLRIHKGNPEDRWWTFGNDGQVYSRGMGHRRLNG
jgi:hypothetical protein